MRRDLGERLTERTEQPSPRKTVPIQHNTFFGIRQRKRVRRHDGKHFPLGKPDSGPLFQPVKCRICAQGKKEVTFSCNRGIISNIVVDFSGRFLPELKKPCAPPATLSPNRADCLQARIGKTRVCAHIGGIPFALEKSAERRPAFRFYHPCAVAAGDRAVPVRP